ncbi:hypothetical protein G9P44_005950 [Scheffersomyces stipitis]|nr:hypothetical protein G9P44_005950 [Scheffersomyces stipitis]
MTSSKLSDHVRNDNNTSTSLVDISADVGPSGVKTGKSGTLQNVGESQNQNVNENQGQNHQKGSPGVLAQEQNSYQSESLQHPPNTIRGKTWYDVSRDLINDFRHKQMDESTSAYSSIIFYANHLVLLSLFFMISIYKNVNYLYRKMVLKFYTLTYYPNKSPQLIRDDVSKLAKIPRVISCILDLKDDDDENGGIDGLIGSISELAAWTVSAGIPHLVIYEYNGVVVENKGNLAQLNRYISKNLAAYFGTDLIPSYAIRIPHHNTVIYSSHTGKTQVNSAERDVDLEIWLLSREDGKPTIVELTKTMSELAQNNELSVNDITIDLIDEELAELVGPEPDLLISFGPSLDLQDYPPWHIRLSEIYWEPENKDVIYAVFIRALQQFSNCKVNVGK